MQCSETYFWRSFKATMLSDVCLPDFRRLSDVCLSRTSGLSLEQRGLGRLNGTEVAHVTRDSDTTFKVKGQGQQAALLTAVLTRQADAAVSVGTYWLWETTATLRSARRRQALRRPQREEGRVHILAAARLQLVAGNNVLANFVLFWLECRLRHWSCNGIVSNAVFHFSPHINQMLPQIFHIQHFVWSSLFYREIHPLVCMNKLLEKDKFLLIVFTN